MLAPCGVQHRPPLLQEGEEVVGGGEIGGTVEHVARHDDGLPRVQQARQLGAQHLLGVVALLAPGRGVAAPVKIGDD